MHNQIIGSTGMDPDNHLAQDNSSSNNNHHAYGTESWVDMSSYTQTTMPDYGSNFYMPPITHGLPSESLSRMPPPPPPQPTMHPPHQPHPQLPMLMVPSHPTWPSLLTHPSTTSFSAPPIAIPPLSTGAAMPKSHRSMTQSTPRKTLTDDDRRRMCEYAEANPGVKQTEIGNMFGVERSTVSKVLRQKEKYLYSEDRTSSPIKKAKGKFPDIEKALSNWIRNAQKSGVPVTDNDIKEKFRFFATTTGNSDTVLKSNSSNWLEKFKQKNGIGPGKLMRRASETNIPDSAHLSTASPSLTPSQASGAMSPASPSAHPSPSPLSANRSDEEKEGLSGYMDFTSESGAYRHTNSQSTTSLSSAFTDTAASSFSGSALSPTAPFTFSPDPNVGGFLPTDQTRHIPPGSSNFQRPRSQTLPTLDLEYMNPPQTSEALTPKYHVSSTAPSSALESPMNEMSAPSFGMDSAIASPRLRHSSSNSSMAARGTGPPVSGNTMASTPIGSSPTSPTQEDARRAADTLLSFIQTSGIVDHNEYLMVVRLTEKLRLHQQATAAKSAQQGMGGLSRIPEGEVEMSNAPPNNLKMETTMSA